MFGPVNLSAHDIIRDRGTGKAAEHEIEFCNVSFAYGENTVLRDISFTADKGQMLALTGESGTKT